jgi:hypothetical protein
VLGLAIDPGTLPWICQLGTLPFIPKGYSGCIPVDSDTLVCWDWLLTQALSPWILSTWNPTGSIPVDFQLHSLLVLLPFNSL